MDGQNKNGHVGCKPISPYMGRVLDLPIEGKLPICTICDLRRTYRCLILFEMIFVIYFIITILMTRA